MQVMPDTLTDPEMNALVTLRGDPRPRRTAHRLGAHDAVHGSNHRPNPALQTRGHRSNP